MIRWNPPPDAPPSTVEVDEAFHVQAADPEALSDQLVIDAATGRVRQAGADTDGAWVAEFRTRCEQDLYRFTKGILKRKYLTPKFHGALAQWVMRRPPYRKLALLPRLHGKTSVISHGLPCHILIQPKESNIYLPGRDGADTRILLAGETEGMAMKNLRVVSAVFESNQLFRALWPHRTYENCRRDSKKWNEREIIVPRPTEFGDPSVRAIGVDGAITGARADACIKDDLISVAAANSPTVMETAIEWHKAVRALYECDITPEWILGTRWAPMDLYEWVITHDPSVEVLCRSIIEDGALLWPEKYALTPTPGKFDVETLQRDHGVMFWLLYMNSANDPELTDFDCSLLRFYTLDAATRTLRWEDAAADLEPAPPYRYDGVPLEPPPTPRIPLRPDTLHLLREAGSEENHAEQYVRLKYS